MTTFNKKISTEPVTPKKKTEVVIESFSDKIIRIKNKGSITDQAIINIMEKYILEMTPKKTISEKVGAANQFKLWKLVSNLLEDYNDEDFVSGWSLLLAYFNNYKSGVLGERYIYRFAGLWNHSKSELSGFQRMINLLLLTCDVNIRKSGLSKTDLSKTLEFGISENGKQKIIKYYD